MIARRRAALALAIVPVVVALARPAAAHDGAGATFTGRAGPYEVLAYDGVDDVGQLDEYAVLLREAATSAPIDGVTVAVSASPASAGAKLQRSAVRADGVGNVYRFTLPPTSPAGWDVTVDVTGPSGAGRASFAVHGPPPPGAAVVVASSSSSSGREGSPFPLAAGIGLLVSSLVVVYLWRPGRVRRG